MQGILNGVHNGDGITLRADLAGYRQTHNVPNNNSSTNRIPRTK